VGRKKEDERGEEREERLPPLEWRSGYLLLVNCSQRVTVKPRPRGIRTRTKISAFQPRPRLRPNDSGLSVFSNARLCVCVFVCLS